MVSRKLDSSPDVGLIEFLMKASAHPALAICGLAVSTLTELLAHVPALASEFLRVLQRRAIWPSVHQNQKVILETYNVGDGTNSDFDIFRETVLKDALIACWQAQRTNYLASCSSAVEEFCAKDVSEKFFLPLEAALFCLEVVSKDFLSRDDPWENDTYMNRLLGVLHPQPAILMSSSFGRERLCSFIQSVSLVQNCLTF